MKSYLLNYSKWCVCLADLCVLVMELCSWMIREVSSFSQWLFVAAKNDNKLVDAPSDFFWCWTPEFFLVPRAWLKCSSCSHTHSHPIYVRGHNDDCSAFTSAYQPNNNNHLLLVMTNWINPDSPIWGLVYKQHSPQNLGSILLSSVHVVDLIMVFTVTGE